MPSLSNSKAIVLLDGYSAESRKIPILALVEDVNIHFDSRDHSGYEQFYTADYGFRSTHGHREDHDDDAGYHDDHSLLSGGAKYYLDPLDDFEHVPEEVIAIEQDDGGYDVAVFMRMYAHIKGTPSEGERTVTSPDGKKWDVVIPATYHFTAVKDPSGKHGYKFADLRIYKDTGLIHDILEKRGHGHLKTVNN